MLSSGASPALVRAATPPVDWPALHRAACAPYRAAGRFAWHFARGKLGRDPVFRHLVERGLIDVGASAAGAPRATVRVLDIGCGQGLLASLLDRLGAGPDGGLVVRRFRYTGIDLMPRDIERARAALGLPAGAAASVRAGADDPVHADVPGRAGAGGRSDANANGDTSPAAAADVPCFICADMRTAAFPPSDVVVILDVLHYVDLDAQRRVLERVRAALGERGRLLLRVGDAAARGRGFAISQWVDRAVAGMRGHRAAPAWGRPLADWAALLADLGFRVEAVPMSGGTPFANVLLVADLAPAVAAACDPPAATVAVAACDSPAIGVPAQAPPAATGVPARHPPTA